MHRALGIREVVVSITDELEQDADLVSLACTSRAFSERALDLLWEWPPLWDLALRMRSEIWRKKSRRVRDYYGGTGQDAEFSTLVLREDMSPDELKDLGDRFTYYAKRARRLSLEEEVMDWNSGADFFTVDVNVLALWATRRNLFPRLQGLEISPRYLTRSPLHDALLPSFLQSRVARTLRWSINEEPAELFGRHHHVLEDICATVEELHLTMPEFETRPWRNRLGLGWATFTGRMLAHTARVRELHITTPITWTDLCLVGSLRTLQELKVTNVVHVPAAPLSMPDNALVNLSDLNLVDLSSEAQVSQAILSRPVNALEWVTVRLPDATTLEHISAVLVGALRQCQLYSLSIEIDEIVGATPTAEEMTSLFQSLPQSATLECLSFVFHQWVPMGITHIDAVLSRYLRLWIWKWERRSVRAVGCRLSLGDLVHLLHHRPMIRGLPIIINSQDIPTAEDVANFGEHRYNSPISIASHADGANLRKTLTHVFPRLQLEDGDLKCYIVPDKVL